VVNLSTACLLDSFSFTLVALKPQALNKTSKFLLLILVTGKFAFAQNPVPNPGFENWAGGNPVSWSTNNVATVYLPITQTSVAHSGALAAQGDVVQVSTVTLAPFLSSTDITGQGFPVAQLYTNVSFYYKFTQAGTVAFVPSAAIFQSNGALISAASQNINTPSSSFTLVNLPFYTFGINPAKCQIAFTINDTIGNPIALGNSFMVDDVVLSNGVGVEETLNQISISKVLPNPVNQSAFIYYSLPEKADVKFDIVNVTGHTVHQIVLNNEIPGSHKIDFNASQLPAGFYNLIMNVGNSIVNFPFAVSQ